jgi:hypothetical protein
VIASLWHPARSLTQLKPYQGLSLRARVDQLFGSLSEGEKEGKGWYASSLVGSGR